jgi:hypothetical protein
MKKMTTKKAVPKKVVAKKAAVKKYQKGGEKGKKEYNEGDTKDGKQSFTTVSKGTYEKNIELVDPSAKKPYRMQVYKDGRLSNFWLTEEQARNQRAVAKKEAGYKKGGTTKKYEAGGMVGDKPGKPKKTEAAKPMKNKGKKPFTVSGTQSSPDSMIGFKKGGVKKKK